MSHAQLLRWSLLGSLGMVPLACGGAVRSRGEDGGDAAGATASGGNLQADPKPRGGSTSSGPVNTGGRPSSGSAGTGVAMGGATTGPVTITCTAPELVPETGLVTCQEGYVHRPAATACEARGSGGAPSEGGAGGATPQDLPRITADTPDVPCDSDASICNAFLYGYCEEDDFGAFCVSGCVTDDDCPARTICVCDNPLSPTGGSCVGSNCATNADCQAGYLCASFEQGCPGRGFACQTPQDQCVSGADCLPEQNCAPDWLSDDRRVCGERPVCGRPFLVASQARVAPVIASSDWLVHAI